MLSVMCAMIDIDSNVNIDKYVVSDIDKHVVALWLHVKDNGLEGLPDVDAYTQGEYGECKELADSDSSTASALVAYYGFAGTRDGIRFNGWHRNKAERHAKVRRFRVGLLHLQKYLQHDKVSILGAQDVLTMPLPTTPTLVYVDPPYYNNNYDRNPHFKVWKENDTMRDRFWLHMKALAHAGNVVAVSEYTCNVPSSGFVSVWSHANPKKGARARRGPRRGEQLFVYDCN